MAHYAKYNHILWGLRINKEFYSKYNRKEYFNIYLSDWFFYCQLFINLESHTL